jgi:hypothetical protein
MTFSSYKMERIGFGLLLCIALLMAFEPLVRLHDPNGARASDAFDVHAGITQLQSELRVTAPVKPSPDSGSSASSVAATPATPGPVPMPFSLRIAPILPWCVFGALAFAFLALVDLFFLKKAFALLSLAGGCLAAIAGLHVMILSSDVQSWAEMLMSFAELSSPGDSALGARILMANSFVVSPGVGLYVLTTCLLLVPLLSFTRAIPRLNAVIRSDRRVRGSQTIHIRPLNSQYPAETCTTVDFSRSGLQLESASNHYYVGMEVYLTRNDRAGGPANAEEHGHVVRVEKMGNAGCRFAIHIISKA